MSAGPLAELPRLFADLKAARSDETRIRAAKRLREWVRFASKGGTEPNFSPTMTVLLTRLSELLIGSTEEKLSGITAVYELTDEAVPDNETKVARLAQFLRGIPYGNNVNDPGLLRLTSKALGHLARAGGAAMTADFVDYECKRALEVLAQPNPPDGRRLAAVLILRELAEAAPTLFYPHMQTFFGVIWAGLSDQKPLVRERAARALNSCLVLISNRRSRPKDHWFSLLYAPVRAALGIGSVTGVGAAVGGGPFKEGPPELVHGALFTIGEFLNKSITEPFILPRFNEISEAVLKHRDSRDKLIRHTVIVLLPRLAHYFPESFVRGGFSDAALAHLLNCLKDTKQMGDRGSLFVAVGRIALAVGSHLSSDALRPQLERIVAAVREGLTPAVIPGGALSRTIKRPFVPEALTCVAMLAGAVGPALLEFTHDLLDPMFSEGMSPMLTEALQAVSSAIPALKPLLQERLLHELCLILANKPFIPPVVDPSPAVHNHYLLSDGAPGSSAMSSLGAQLACLAGNGAETVGLALAEGAAVGELFGSAAGAISAATAAVGAGYYSLNNLMPPSMLEALAASPNAAALLALGGTGSMTLASGAASAAAAHAASQAYVGTPAYNQAVQAGMDPTQAAAYAAALSSAGSGGASASWTGFGGLPFSAQAVGSSRYAAGSGLAASTPTTGSGTLAALASLLSATSRGGGAAGGPGAGQAAGGRDGRAGGGGMGGADGSAGGPGSGGAHGHGLLYSSAPPIHLATPGAMSWAKNLPSSALAGGMGGNGGDGSGMGGGSGAAGGLGTSAAALLSTAAYGLGGYGPAIGDGPGMLILASARGISVDVVRQALHTLGTFDFSGVPLLPFVREVVMAYLDDDDAGVRLEAALTCCRLLTRPSDLIGKGVDPLLTSGYYGHMQEMAASEEELELALDDPDDFLLLGEPSSSSSSSSAADGNTQADALPQKRKKQHAHLSASAVGLGDSDEALVVLQDDEQLAAQVGGTSNLPAAHALAASSAALALPGAMSETQRERLITKLQSQLSRKLKLPQHPLLVFGTDMISLGPGIGNYTSPVALALAGYAGGLADVGRPSADALAGASGSAVVTLERLQEVTDATGGAAAGGQKARGLGFSYGGSGSDGSSGKGASSASSLASVLGAMAGIVGSGPTLMVVTQLLQRLLMMAVTDPEPSIRFEILASLDSRFDSLLVEEENLRLLFQGLQDENHVVREAVLALLGRLAAHNPALILQALRTTLISVLGELEFADAHPASGSFGGSLVPLHQAAAGGDGSGAAAGGGVYPPRRNSGSLLARGVGTGVDGTGSAGGASGSSGGGDGSGSGGGSGTSSNDAYAASAMLTAAIPGSGLNSTAPASLRIAAFHASAGTTPTTSSLVNAGGSGGAFGLGSTGGVGYPLIAAGSGGGGGREHAARMLGLLIRATQRLVVPYVPVILRSLLPQVWATSPGRTLAVSDMTATVPLSLSHIAGMGHPDLLSTSVLAALGELSAVGADAITPYLPVLMPLVVDALMRGAYALGIGHQFITAGATTSAIAGGASNLGGKGGMLLVGALNDGGAGGGGGQGNTSNANGVADLDTAAGGGGHAGSAGGHSLQHGGAGGGGAGEPETGANTTSSAAAAAAASAAGAAAAVSSFASFVASAYAISDPSRFTEVAVRSLGLLAENTGHVIVPYLDHPNLLQVLLGIMSRGGAAGYQAASATAASTSSGGGRRAKGGLGSSSSSAPSSSSLASGFASTTLHWSLRREAMRTFGILGALDPYRHRMAQIAQAQRGAAAIQAAIQARLAAAIASAAARGRRLAGAGLTSAALTKGVRPAPQSHMISLLAAEDPTTANPLSSFAIVKTPPASSTPFKKAGGVMGAGTASGGATTAVTKYGSNAIIIPPEGMQSSGGAWDLAFFVPAVAGVALGGGIDAEPMEAAMAGLAGESGSNVGINLDELSLDMAGLGGGTVGGLGLGLDDVYLLNQLHHHHHHNAGQGGGASQALALLNGDPFAAAAAMGRAGGLAGVVGGGFDGAAGSLGAGGGGGGGGVGGALGLVAGGPGGDGGPLATVANLPASAILPSMINPSDDFFPTVALTALLNILADESLALHHTAVLQAVMMILRSLGQHCVTFLPRVLPTFLAVLKSTSPKGGVVVGGVSSSVGGAGGSGGRGPGSSGGADGSGDGSGGVVIPISGAAGSASGAGSGVVAGDTSSQAALRETVLQQLSALVMLVRHHLRPWLPSIFSILRDVWPASLPHLLRLVEAVAAALGEECKPYIASLIPHMLSVLAHDGTRPVLNTAVSASVEMILRESAGGGQGVVGGGAGGPGGAGGSAGGGPGSAPGAIIYPLPSPARPNTRHVLHTLVVLVCGGRRALWGGHRRLIDDHLHLLVPALARLVDAGLASIVRQGAVSAAMAAADTEAYYAAGGGAQAGGGPGAAANAAAQAQAAAAAAAATAAAAMGAGASNSSSLDAYGPVAPIVRRTAIDTIAAMAAAGVPLAPYASRIIHPLARSIADCSGYTPMDIKRAAVDTLSLLALQLREEFLIWVPTVRKACLLATLGSANGFAAGSLVPETSGGGVGPMMPDGPVAELAHLMTYGRAGSGGGAGTLGANAAGSMGVLSHHHMSHGSSSSAAAASATAHGHMLMGGGQGAGGAGPMGGSNLSASSTAALGIGVGGVGGTGHGSVVRHETYERLVALLLGFGSGYGYTGDDSLALFGYGPPLPLPTNPVDLAELLYDPGTCCSDGSGIRIAAALALSVSGSMLPNVTVPGPGGTVLDGAGGAATPYGLLGEAGNDRDTFNIGIGALGAGALGLTTMGPDGLRKLPVNQDALRKSWETAARSTREDWAEWMRRLSVDLLKESPSPALRACSVLAQVYTPLASELFNAAFVAVWGELYDDHQDNLVQALEAAFTAESVPTYILQALLNLAEFMEHDEKALPIDVRLLGGLAERVRAFAKALHYKEMEFHSSPQSAACIEALISINNQLDQPEAAVGILTFAQHSMLGFPAFGVRAAHGTAPNAAAQIGGGGDAGAQNTPVTSVTGTPSAASGVTPASAATGAAVLPLNGMEVQDGWYEKLGRWEAALEGYTRKQRDHPNSVAVLLGRLRCLKALGEWSQLDELARDAWPRLANNDTGREMVAPLAARAAWALGDWQAMEEYTAYIDEFTQQGAFLRAILAVHRQAFEAAQHFIDRSRKLVASEFASVSGSESYSRAYRRLVTVQQLSEMEEVLTHVRLSAAGNAPGASSYLNHVRSMWAARLRGCARNVDVWNRILSVRSLVSVAAENTKQWVQFASLCRRSGRSNMSLKVLTGLAARTAAGGGNGSLLAIAGNNNTSANAAPAFIQPAPAISFPGSPTHPRPVPAISIPSNVLNGTAGPTSPGAAVSPSPKNINAGQQYPSDSRLSSATGAGGAAANTFGMVASRFDPPAPLELVQASAKLGAYSDAHPEVQYAFFKHLWHCGQREAAVRQLKALTQSLDEHAAARAAAEAKALVMAAAGGNTADGSAGSSSGAAQSSSLAHLNHYGRRHTLRPDQEQALRVRCHLRLGQWQEQLLEAAMASYSATGSTLLLESLPSIVGDGVAAMATAQAPEQQQQQQQWGGASPGGISVSSAGMSSGASVAGGSGSSLLLPPSSRLHRLLSRGLSVSSMTSTVQQAQGLGASQSNGNAQPQQAMQPSSVPSTGLIRGFVIGGVPPPSPPGAVSNAIPVAMGAGLSASSSTSSSSTSSAALGKIPSDAYAQLIAPVISAFRTATHECGEAGFTHYRAWHSWSILNFDAVEHHAENLRIGRERAKAALAAAQKQKASAASAGAMGQLSLGASVSGSASRKNRQSGAPASSSAAPAIAVGSGVTSDDAPPSAQAIAQVVTAHAVAAVKGFFRSIALGRTRLKAYVLQDLLRLLTLWFSHGESSPVRQALEAGLASGAVSIEVWLQVIPQLIARIQIQGAATRKLLHQLLIVIGAAHPQALVYPLTVASKSASVPRRTAALAVLSSMRRRWARLVDQAEMVSRELIRVAILWHEMWHSGLEEASRQYFGDGNVQAMLQTLIPLHELMTNPGPQTLREAAFVQTFGRELETAYKWLLAYKASGRVGDLSQAWDIYYHVFRKLNKLLPTFTSLELPFVSPTLLTAHDLELSVPGTYHAGAPNVTRIMSFCPFVDILPSKQRPRKITMLGSDGRRYTFLLKGHEDLRQDERVMQLFGLVNTLLSNDGETSRRDLSIRRYAVTPLSHNAGVVGWVPNCDTLHALIREYRDARKILLNIEHRLMLQMAPMFDHLTVLQRVEVFRFALENTTGQDLYKVLWLKSASSEVWLERRTNYTRSLAVMSIVGYILGLGDRHPSNLMLDRVSGKILHIDFGDCFETAMTRDKFPERIPFRLTRMLVNAMEVSGIEGNYRSTCEAVMRVMRQHRDSVMAMLEAFVHDPLINWRLLNAGPAGGAGADGAAQGGNAGPAGATSASGSAGQANGAANTSVPAANSSAAAAAYHYGANSAVSGAARLAEQNPEARTLVQQGLAFAAEAEAATLAQAVAETGFDPEAAAGGATGADGPAVAAMARSLAVSLHASGARGDRERELMSMLGPEGAAADTEALNERAVAVIKRIQAKLTGKDFAETDPIGRLMSAGIGLLSASGEDVTVPAALPGAPNDQASSAIVGAFSPFATHAQAAADTPHLLDPSASLDVPAQVQRLICAATSHENLSQAYVGWCATW